MIRLCLALCFLGLVSICIGCDQSKKANLVEGKGTLTYKGAPLKQFSVRFVPTSGGPSSSGVTNANGEFVLTCEDGRPGVVSGNHRVIIIDVSQQAYLDDPLNPNNQPIGQNQVKNPTIPVEWSSQQSPLTIEVKSQVPIQLHLQ